MEIEKNTEESILSLRPYKTLGIFADANAMHMYSAGKKSFVAASTHRSFKIYSLPQLKVTLLGPTFAHKIRAIQAQNEFLFVGERNRVHKMRYYHSLYTIQFEKDSRVAQLLILGNILVVLLHSSTRFPSLLKIVEHNSSQTINSIDLHFSAIQVLHPATYLNKVLVVGRQHCELWNIATAKRVYEFNSIGVNKLENSGRQTQKEQPVISVAECSPVLDVVAFALNDGRVCLHNIRQDIELFSLKAKQRGVCLAFSKIEYPLLAVGDEYGNLTVWDLNEKKVFSYLKTAHLRAVSYLQFQSDAQCFLSASGEENALLQWNLEEFADKKFSIVRQRRSLLGNIKKLRFLDDLHVLACSNHASCEIRDFSLLNECMSATYTLKQQSRTKLEARFQNTENSTTSELSETLDFSFSNNRSGDWANILTLHSENDRACLFSSSEKCIVKKSLRIGDNAATQLQEIRVTAVVVSKCGNFGVLGFSDGRSVKVNLQSGSFNREFLRGTHTTPITSLFVDDYNKFLVSGCKDSIIAFWDFYSAALHKSVNLTHQQASDIDTPTVPRSLLFARGGNYSHHFLIALSDNTLEVWDFLNLKRGRRLSAHTQRIMDACFTQSNKHIISCSLDRTLKVWDLLSNTIVGNFELERPIVSLDVSPDNQLLATAYQGSKEIHLWHNLIAVVPYQSEQLRTVRFHSRIRKSDKDERKYLHLKKVFEEDSQEIQNALEAQQGNDSTHSEDSQLIRFTALEDGKWLPLVYLEQIKERNKAEDQDEYQFKMPFFLDFQNKDEIRKQMIDEYDKSVQEKSHILSQQRNKHLEELGTNLDIIFTEHKTTSAAAGAILAAFKEMKPAQIDYEMRRFVFGSTENVIRLLNLFAEFFEHSEQEFDLKNTYFKAFLNISIDEIMRLPNEIKTLERIKQKINENQQRLQEKILMIRCLAETFARLPNI